MAEHPYKEGNMKKGQQSVTSGLSTDTYKVSAADMYQIFVRTTDLPPSGAVITLSQSGSQSVSVSTPTTSPKQRHIEINAKFNCAIGDILSVVVSSSAPVDQPPNLIKTTINLKQGI
jgi:hypothetical protein